MNFISWYRVIKFLILQFWRLQFVITLATHLDKIHSFQWGKLCNYLPRTFTTFSFNIWNVSEVKKHQYSWWRPPIYFALYVKSILFSISLLSVEDILEALLVRCAGCVLAVEPGLALPLLLGLGQLRDVAVVKPEHHHKILCIVTWCQYLDLPSWW